MRRIAKYLIIAAFAVCGVFLGATTASAAGGGAIGGGGSGSGGGGGGGAWTRYGFEWRVFNLNGSGPSRFTDGTQWNYVKSACSGSDSVYAFVVYTRPNAGGDAWVYRYDSSWYNFRNPIRSRFIASEAAARAEYDALPANIKGGYAWGSNVAWFCRWDGDWNLSRADITVRPTPTDYKGVTVTYTHRAYNDSGNGAENINIRALQSGVQKGSWTLNIGSNAWSADRNSTQGLAKTDVGRGRYCRNTEARPKSGKDGRAVTSGQACVDVYSPWLIRPSSSISLPDGCLISNPNRTKPGCAVTFKHTVQESNARVLKNDTGGNVKVDATVYQYVNAGNNTTKPSSLTRVDGAGGSNTSFDESAYIINAKANSASVTQDHVGKTICQFVRSSYWGRNRPSNSANGFNDSTPVCVYVPYNYATAVQNDMSTYGKDAVVEAGTTVKIGAEFSLTDVGTGTKLNSYHTKSKTLNWALNVTCEGLRAGEVCSGGSSGQASIDTATGSFKKYQDIVVPDYNLGARLCFVASIAPRAVILDVDQGDITVAEKYCFRVGKAPKVQVRNGGVSAPGGITAKVTNRLNAINGNGSPSANRGIYGSWSEYEAVSASNINGLASLAAFQKPAQDIAQATYSRATFGNVDPGGTTVLGRFKNGEDSSVANVVDYFYEIVKSMPSGVVYSDNTILTDKNEESLYNGTGKVVIGGGVVPKGHTAIIYTTGDIEITGNIEYENGVYSSTLEIPQVVIISRKNIRIHDSVTHVDAWLLAHSSTASVAGTIYTCAGSGESVNQVIERLSGSVCSNRLDIGGPIYADKLHLLRTAGAEATNPKEPAEIFTLPSSTFLWAYDYANKKNVGYAATRYSIDIPPRY
ncbi:MAG: hypothetical protein LBH36_02360 [Candidatus Nomurabacteria bacterium]|jgi:hypothetical protein|nr:hypothetical protein [Candidatus Nomurabacteria bacterium]